MKKLISSTVFAFALLSTAAQAKPFFGTISKYINTQSLKIIEIASNDISEDKKTAKYFDHEEHRFTQANLSDYSKSTREEIGNVQAGELILAKVGTELKLCEVYYLFENHMAVIACQTKELDNNIGVSRPKREMYNVSEIESDQIIAEISEKDGFKKHDIVKMQNGNRVRIESIFENGEVAVQKMSLGYLDTSPVILKLNIIRTNLSSLSF